MDQEHRELDSRTDAEWAVDQLTSFRRKFDPFLKNFLDKCSTEVERIRPELTRLMTVSSEFVMNGGKRLRPAFAYYGWKAASGNESDEALLDTILSLELVHAGALVQDDLIDNSEMRKGKPTVHRIFGQDTRNDDTGRYLAIIAGNRIWALAEKAFSSFPDYGDGYKKARNCFNTMCEEINYGEYLDIQGDLNGQVDEDWIMKVMRYKTASYTVEKPLLIGALLGNAPAEILEPFSEYGVKLGIAFQIKDDILGMFGNEQKVGKPVDSDLKEGKQTLLVFRVLEALARDGRSAELEKFRAILGNPNLTTNDYLWCQEQMKLTGAFAYSQQRVEQLTAEAKGVLAQMTIAAEAKRYLLGIADFLVARDY